MAEPNIFDSIGSLTKLPQSAKSKRTSCCRDTRQFYGNKTSSSHESFCNFYSHYINQRNPHIHKIRSIELGKFTKILIEEPRNKNITMLAKHNPVCILVYILKQGKHSWRGGIAKHLNANTHTLIHTHAHMETHLFFLIS